MSFRRDPLDRRYPERLTASTAVSLAFHALLAALLFTVMVSSTQEGATENVSGGEVVTLERRTPLAVAQAPAAAATLPLPNVPRVAPVRHAPVSQPMHQRLPQNLHILAKEQPSAPPNPKPIPQQSVEPAPQLTQNVFEPTPANELPAAPVTVPTVAPITVAMKAPATAAPSPAPTARATEHPSPKPPAPTAAPTAKPATPAPVAPSAAPTATAAAVRATAAPSASPAPAARASVPPAPRAGVPSPSPTNAAAAVAKTPGTAPTAGPKGQGSPGPTAGAGQQKAAPPRPIVIKPTASPPPSSGAGSSTPGNINDRLRALLPNNPVNPTSKSYHTSLSLTGHMEPTPPPDVLAQTKFIYKNRGGSEGLVEMWVTSARKAGITTMCTGWMVRYPLNEVAPVAGGYAGANGTQMSIGGGAPKPGLLAPIVEGIVTEPCEGRLLVPFAASSAPSP